MSFCYRVYGLQLLSPVELPELTLDTDDRGSAAGESAVRLHIHGDLALRQDVLAAHDNSGREVPEGSSLDDFQVSKAATTLWWPTAGRFELQHGREIHFYPIAGVDQATVRAFLLGPVLSLLLHQRGFLVMHASAVAVHDGGGRWGAVGFMGRSGAGKSTLAAALHARGHRLISDDIVAIPSLAMETDQTAPFEPTVMPGYASLRLRPQTLDILGKDPQSLPLLYPAENRRVAPMKERFLTGGVPLRRLYVLDISAGIEEESLPASMAMPALFQNTYCAGLLAPAESAREFIQCGALARKLPVYRLARPRDLGRLDETAALVESALREVPRLLAIGAVA